MGARDPCLPFQTAASMGQGTPVPRGIPAPLGARAHQAPSKRLREGDRWALQEAMVTHSCLSHFALDRPRAANKGVSIKEGHMGHQRHPDEGPQFSKELTVVRTDRS